MFEYNKDIDTRDRIIFDNYRPEEYHGGIRRFRVSELVTDDMGVLQLHETVSVVDGAWLCCRTQALGLSDDDRRDRDGDGTA